MNALIRAEQIIELQQELSRAPRKLGAAEYRRSLVMAIQLLELAE
jgi:hypothetical protein